MSAIRINKIHYPVTTLGFGRRVGIWVQGCSLGCGGCLSRDTWGVAAGHRWEITALLAEVSRYLELGCDGITISGGEPFEQAGPLGELLPELRKLVGPDRDLLCYSGLSYRVLCKEHAHLLSHLDALIPEPFRARASPGGIWRGSSNQPLIPLSTLGQARYLGQAPESAPKAIQVAVSRSEVFFIGIPQPGDLQELERKLADKGIRFGGVSWRA